MMHTALPAVGAYWALSYHQLLPPAGPEERRWRWCVGGGVVAADAGVVVHQQQRHSGAKVKSRRVCVCHGCLLVCAARAHGEAEIAIRDGPAGCQLPRQAHRMVAAVAVQAGKASRPPGTQAQFNVRRLCLPDGSSALSAACPSVHPYDRHRLLCAAYSCGLFVVSLLNCICLH